MYCYSLLPIYVYSIMETETLEVCQVGFQLVILFNKITK